MPRPVALLDANVLYPARLRDLLIRLAIAGLPGALERAGHRREFRQPARDPAGPLAHAHGEPDEGIGPGTLAVPAARRRSVRRTPSRLEASCKERRHRGGGQPRERLWTSPDHLISQG